ncbi:MAG: phage/plasmid primase, P4 family [Bryobacteraceae bacterium]
MNTYRDLDKFDGIGYEIAEPYVFIDLDGCRDAETGTITPEAEEIVSALSSFTEVSISGTGLHILCKTTKPLPKAGARTGWIEIYSGDRFVALTGNVQDGATATIEERTDAVHDLYRRVFGDDGPAPPQPGTRETNDVDVDERIAKAFKAKNGVRFARLMTGDMSDYLKRDGTGPDQSRADLAFCSMLAFWLDRDPMKMDAAFRKSGLMREKWDERRGSQTYGEITVRKAIASCRDTYGERQQRKSTQHESAFAPISCAGTPDGLPAFGFRLTDTGNSEQLVARFGRDIRYCPSLKAWFIFDGKRWVRDDRQSVRVLARETVRAMFEDANQLSERKDRDELLRHAHQSESAARQAAMLKMAEVLVPVGEDELDTSPRFFNCNNGTIDLTTGELRPHRREDLLTRMVPFNYVSGATSVEWEQFLDQTTAGNAEYRNFLKRLSGYVLLGEPKEQIAVLVHGAGATGKSTFMAVLQSAIGSDYCHTLSPETLLKRNSAASTAMYDLAELRGKRLVVASEVDDGRAIAESIFKSLTGGDSISARLPYQRFQNAAPQCTLFIQCNHVPKISYDDDAMWRRIIRLPFNQVVAKGKRDPNLKKRLVDPTTSLPGVLAWIVEGALEYLRVGLQVPDFIIASTEALRDEMDTVGEFIGERCEIDPALWASSDQLWKGYCDWCLVRGESPSSRKAFAASLVDHGAIPTKRLLDSGQQARAYRGIGLLNANPGGLVTDDDLTRLQAKIGHPRSFPAKVA